jgi:hypothetical protein
MPSPLRLLLALVAPCIGFLCGAGSVAAQDAAPLSPDRVTFYTEPNYKGEALAIEAGASVENLDRLAQSGGKSWAGAISSVRVDGQAKALVYSAAGFRGEQLEITRSIADLYSAPRSGQAGATWDRAILAVNVTSPAPVAPAVPAPRPAPRETIPVTPPSPPPTVVVVPRPAPPPPAVVVVPPPPPPRRVVDLRAVDAMITQAFREVLRRPPDPAGLRTYRDRVINDGWTERDVIRQLQRSEEARGIDPTTAITQIYREVLGRDPDPNGLAHYRSKWREGWTQGQIRDDLRRSHEGRDTYIRAAITRAYRELLGRDPDPAGYATYERLMREKGMTERELRATLMSGDEYRQRKRKR